MTTEELENKLKIGTNTCIHCPTLELAKQVLSIFHQLGLRWFSGEYYTLNHNWDILKKNTVYYPFDGLFSPLKFAQLTGYKIISAEEFIALHIEDEEFDLKNYEPKGALKGFPKEIISRMLDYQVEQGNKRDVSVFEKRISTGYIYKGFDWGRTKERLAFWEQVILNRNFDLFFLFFEKYPKKDNQEDNSQKFKIGDKVYDILLKEVGIVQDIVYSSSIPYGLSVEFKSGVKSYTINGCYIPEYKNPHLLHYQDDYNYDVIDFNNLPKRQYKRWRAEKEKYYYFIRRDDYNSELDRVCETKDYYSYISNEQYKIGNYFQTKEEAQKIVDKTKKYFQELIKI